MKNKIFNSKIEFGGGAFLEKRKTARPFNKNKPIHTIFRSENARGKYSLIRYRAKIEILLHQLCDKHSIQILEFANVRTHLHLLLKSNKKKKFQNFLKEFSSKIALYIYAGKGKFWTSIVYTKLVVGEFHLKNVLNYILQNRLESLGIISTQPRGMGCLKHKSFIILDST